MTKYLVVESACDAATKTERMTASLGPSDFSNKVDDVLIVWILGDAEVEEGGLLEFVFVGAKDEGGKEGCVIHE